MLVAAGFGKAIRATNNGHRADINAQVQIVDHALNDCQLLGVLLPEVGAVRPDEAKQLCHHGGDPIKVPGAAGAFQLCAHLARAYPYFRCALWIHLLYIGCEDDVHAGRFQKLRIGLECPRVVAVIIAVSKVGKLQWVYKNTRHNQVVLGSCSTDQA